MESSTKEETIKAGDTSISVKGNDRKPENRWVWVLQNADHSTSKEGTDQHYGDVFSLRHPTTGIDAAFLFTHSNNCIQEILTCEDNKRSWFIDESVKSDGKMKMSTSVDPIFLVLPYLRKSCSTQALPIDQLLCDEKFPKIELLLKCSELKSLRCVADQKGPDDLQAYKYNEEKTLKWLEEKTQRVVAALQKLGIGSIMNGVASTAFTKSSRGSTSNSEKLAFFKYAHGIVSEYIEPDLSKKLLEHLNLVEEPPNTLKRKSTSNTPEAKKLKTEKDENVSNNVVEAKRVEVKLPKQTSKEKLRAKGASSSKSITSFFKKA